VSVVSSLTTKSYVMVIARTAVVMTRMGKRRATYSPIAHPIAARTIASSPASLNPLSTLT